MRRVQKELEVRLRDNKEAYRRKLEGRLQQNNSKVWAGAKQITGFKAKQKSLEGSLETENELNLFINRVNPSTHTKKRSNIFFHPVSYVNRGYANVITLGRSHCGYTH